MILHFAVYFIFCDTLISQLGNEPSIVFIITVLKLCSVLSRFSRQAKDPEEFLAEVDVDEKHAEARIVTPSRTILPPHTPHFIYFNPADTIAPTPARFSQLQDEGKLIIGRSLQKVLSPSGASSGKVDQVMLTTVPSTCLSDPSITVCEYDQDSYPTKFVDTVLQTYRQEMRILLKYAKPTMLKVLNNFIIFRLYNCI